MYTGEFDRKDEEFAQNFCVVVATAIKAAKLKKSKAAIKALADEAAITAAASPSREWRREERRWARALMSVASRAGL